MTRKFNDQNDTLYLPISKKIIQSSVSKGLVLFFTVGLNIN